VTTTLQQDIESFARAQVGKPYDFGGLYGFLARKNWAKAEKWFCSELVSAAFACSGAPLLRLEPHKTSPGDLRTSPLLWQFALLFATPASMCTAIPGEGIRVALYRGVSIPSRIIRFRTWSDYSHASLVLPDNSVIEALPFRGVVAHARISEFHTPETPIEIWQLNWAAIERACANPPPMLPVQPDPDVRSLPPTRQDAPGLVAALALLGHHPAACDHFAQGLRRFAQGMRMTTQKKELRLA
jgi:hypothetical protein